METTYFGDATAWYHGPGAGPWVMTDQENNLVGCVNPDGSKNCPTLPVIPWRFVTGIAKGEPHHWTSMGGDSQQGDLQVMFDGKRVSNQYDPMRKQGAILLGNGGDNSNSSQGTFYEGVMTAAGTFPTDATDQKVQANIVAAKYDEPQLSLAPASAAAKPPGLQVFSPGTTQETTVTFKNTTGAPVLGLNLGLSLPKGWTGGEKVLVDGPTENPYKIIATVAPGASVTETFKVTSGPAFFNGDLVATANWRNYTTGERQSNQAAEKVRNVSPVKINEFAASATSSFIELFNAGAGDVDLSNWTLTEHGERQAIFSSVKIPAGTKLAAKGFYLLGLSDSGLAVPAKKGDTTIYVRSTNGMNVGDTVEIDTGSGVETHKIASVGTAAGNATTLWQPLPDGPVITVPAGSTNVPFAGGGGGRGGGGGALTQVGQKIGLGYGATYPVIGNFVESYEVVTVTEVGKPGTQSRLAAAAMAGATTIRVTIAGNISVGDKINLDIDSVGHGTETVTVAQVGAAGGGGRGGGGGTLELAAPLKFNHSANLPFSVRGTGLSFQPKTAWAHSTNEPILPLGTGLTLDGPLAGDHPIDAVVRDAAVTTEGYQGNPAPNQWFGGPALAGNFGSMVLRDGSGLVVDSLNYGEIVDPWAGEGYQAESGASQRGCFVASPAANRGGRRGGAPAAATPAPSRSAGRNADGADTGSNCADFQVQAATPGAANQKAP